MKQLHIAKIHSINRCLIAIFCLLATSMTRAGRAADTYPASMASGTIPTVYINTEGSAPIESKIDYIPGSLYIATPEGGRWQACGSAEEPISLNIRGRGNWSWYKSPKKAYKIKFDTKTSVLGMPKHKHFALICYDPFYPTLWLAPALGLELGRLINFPWTPLIEPVEVVLNGEYRGIYLLVESMKTGPERLDISTQPENSTDESLLPYGWLVELDNQNDDYQITVPAKNAVGYLRVTHKEPEILSDRQRQWLTDEFTYLTELIEEPGLHPDDKWTDHFDLESLARYIIVREVLHDVDGYSGSQYFYKDIDSEKWHAGPLWDMELWPNDKTAWIADDGAWSMLNWIPQMMQSAELRDAFEREWKLFYPQSFKRIYDYIDSFAGVYLHADLANTLRWPSESISLDDKIAIAKLRLLNNAFWIEEHTPWVPTAAIDTLSADRNDLSISLTSSNITISATSELTQIEVFDIKGIRLISAQPHLPYYQADLSSLPAGLYIVSASTTAKTKKQCIKL